MSYSPMSAASRSKQLAKLKSTKPHGRRDIYYKNDNVPMHVYKIPLECLIFNKYNHRIATFVKTHEMHNDINVETKEGSQLIEKFLKRSNPRRNKRTKADLKQKGQQEPGIVTADGIIISGNRRFMLLKEIAKDAGDLNPFFKAVILEDTLESDPKEIMKLETIYQTGVDGRVDYSPIQKYLQCKEFKDRDVSVDEIASMMGEKASTIEKYLEIMELMDAYLGYCGYQGIYTVLDVEQQVDERFKEMHSYLKRYKNNPPGHCSWQIEVDDIDDLRLIYFDYIRLGERVPVDEARQIGNPNTLGRKKSFFVDAEVWQSFRKNHFEMMDEFRKHEQSLEQMRSIEFGDERTLIQRREEKFKSEIGGKLEGNFSIAKNKIENQADKDEPLKLLRKAMNSLDAIDENSEAFTADGAEVKSLAHKIRKKSELFIKVVERKQKQ